MLPELSDSQEFPTTDVNWTEHVEQLNHFRVVMPLDQQFLAWLGFTDAHQIMQDWENTAVPEDRMEIRYLQRGAEIEDHYREQVHKLGYDVIAPIKINRVPDVRGVDSIQITSRVRDRRADNAGGGDTAATLIRTLQRQFERLQGQDNQLRRDLDALEMVHGARIKGLEPLLDAPPKWPWLMLLASMLLLGATVAVGMFG